ncbi:lasso peptide biosynthesis B2 protein [Halosimplex litoreum]|uniref:Lasso peptide biosynthesis B2 protein n=1 Tax=Halosimplex litoreum TaxID=1198301 RepID=A0A7T3KWP4_9EURY|nr:lasso peptide biosynthesis B2 protein [Halosimplex litoreum]
MDRVKRFVSAPPGDKLRLAVASGLLVAIWGGLVVVSFDRLRSVLAGTGDVGSLVVPGTPTAGQVVAAVDVADSWVPGTRTCLVRSLTAEVLLRTYGHSFEHRIGVDRDSSDSVRAHSWIEFEGEVLIGDVDNLEEYEPLPPISTGNER